MGTPDFAVLSLDALLSSKHEIVAVVTQPDRPKGRHLHLQPSPVKVFAQEKNLPILQPSNLNDEIFKASISSLNPKAIIVVAYGKIIPKWILSLPPYGCINVHASLLPKYRGAAPIQRAIMDGCSEAGITTMLLDEGMDTGDILLQSKVQIESAETSGDLAKKLSKEGAKLLLETLNGLAERRITPRKQEENKASYAPKIEKEEALIDWSRPALKLRNLIRALNPAPGAYTYFKGERLKVWEAKISEETDSSESSPGTVVGFESNGIIVATGTQPLVLTMLQPENKKRMTASEFLRGHKIEIGEKLG
jgi:methionyl-tRNA formyltransferase